RQSRAEPHLLDGQIARHELDFFGHGDALARADPQREAEKVRHELRHGARVGRARSAQRRDGVETVEEKVRVDLRLERLQLRLARTGNRAANPITPSTSDGRSAASAAVPMATSGRFSSATDASMAAASPAAVAYKASFTRSNVKQHSPADGGPRSRP